MLDARVPSDRRYSPSIRMPRCMGVASLPAFRVTLAEMENWPEALYR